MILQALTAIAAGGAECLDPNAWVTAACLAASGAQAAGQAAQDTFLTGLAEQWMASWQQMEMFFFASWTMLPLLIDLNSPDGTTIWLQRLLSNLTWFFAILGVLVSVGWTFFSLGLDRMRALGARLLVLMGVNSAGGVIVVALDALAHAGAIGILVAVGINGQSTLAKVTIEALNPGIPVILGFVGAIGMIIQWAIMIGRGALVPLLVGVWPTLAAVATLGSKKATESFDKVTAWLIAFIIYPLVAAIVYAAAFRLKSGADGLGGLMYGFALEMLALFLLPAIMRLIAPLTQALGKAYGGEMAVKFVAQAAELAVAAGAIVVSAGAAGAAFGAKAAGSAKAASQAGGQGATGNITPVTAGSTTSGAGSSTPTPGSGGGSSTGSGTAPTGGGADNVNSGTATPTGAPSPGAGAGSTGAGSAGSPQPATRAGQRAARQPSQAPAQGGHDAKSWNPPSEAEKRIEARERQLRVQAAAQAAQTGASSMARGAREAMGDVDDMIGGKHG